MSKINSAESIRGLACVAVILSHIALVFFPAMHNPKNTELPNSAIFQFIHNSPLAFFYSGSAAVYVFFVLSGFVLSYACIKDREKAKQKLFSMAVKRYPRLAIPAIISTLLVWAAFLYPVDTSNVSSWFSENWGKQNNSILIALYDGAINSFLYGKPIYNRVLWTMQIELFGSFVVLILLFSFLKSRILFSINIFIFLILSLFISVKFFLGIGCFIVGMLIYIFCKPISLKFALPLLLTGLYFAGAHNDSTAYVPFAMILGNKTYLLLTAISGPLIVYSILMNERISNLLDKRFFVYLGKLSFSMYLLHMLVLYLVGVPFFNILLTNFSFALSASGAALLVLFTTFVISIPYSNYVDDLSIKVGRMIEKAFTKKFQ